MYSSKLSEIIQPGSVAGYSSASFLALTNLKTGTPIISGGGDQQCAALGSGILPIH
jgi:sugar (pentulose or hexulose) kinase